MAAHALLRQAGSRKLCLSGMKESDVWWRSALALQNVKV
jgi:hypothetical protein